jgi:hypothetical protein
MRRFLCCLSCRLSRPTVGRAFTLLSVIGATTAVMGPASAGDAMSQKLEDLGQRHFAKPHDLRQTNPFVVLHDTPDRSARNAARLLSLTHHTFYAAMRNAGFKLKPIDDALVCLVFSDKATFIDYGHAADQRDMAWSGGYYSARTNRVAIYERPAYRIADVVAHPEQRNPSTRLTPRDQNHALGSDDYLAQSLARTTHEAAHQLAFNSGVQKRGVMYPFWVSEGLASSFEINAQQMLGPAAANPRRRESLRQAHNDGQLRPLEQFIVATRIDTSSSKAISRAYAQAWGLFRYLFRHRPAAMRAYLAKLKQAPLGRRTEAGLRADFHQAFGPMAEVKDGWQRWLAGLSGTG